MQAPGRLRRWAGLGAGILLAQGQLAWALSPGQTDAFGPGDTEGWFSRLPNPYALQTASGGPGGAADTFLQTMSDALGAAGSKLVVFGGPQWLGDYRAAGITALRMDLNNLGDTDLSLRVQFAEVLSPALSVYASTQAVQLPAHSGWQSVTFSLDAASLAGSLPVMQHVNFMRVMHAVSPSAQGDEVAASLGIDNVTAVAAVPEPATAALLALGLAGLASRRRTR